MGVQQVGLYSKVIVEIDNRRLTYTLVKPEEINILENKISIESPLGKALLNHTVGDIVKVFTPSGLQEYKIIAID